MKRLHCKTRRVNRTVEILLLVSVLLTGGVLPGSAAVSIDFNPSSPTIINNVPSGSTVASVSLSGCHFRSNEVVRRMTADGNGNFGYASGNIVTAKASISAGTYTVTIQMIDSTGQPLSCNLTKSVQIVVKAAPPPPTFGESATVTRSVPENTPADTNIGDPVTATGRVLGSALTYSLGGTDAASFAIGSTTGQLKTQAALDYEMKSTYTVTVIATRTNPDGTAEATVTISVTDVDEVTDVNENNPPLQPSVRSNNPQPNNENNPPLQPSVRSNNPQPNPDPASEPEPTPPRRIIVYQCPVGWQRTDTFGRPTPKVFIRSVEVEIDRNDPSGLYKPVALEIYADPTEGLSDLAGWKLKVAVPYNHGREYRLTAENAVFNADGIARIESPDAEPFPMTILTYIGQVLPGFDYRLFSEKNTRVDFAISCYEGTNATLQQLETMESPRVERTVDPTNFQWDDILFFRSKWRVPVAETAPAAPGLSSTQQRLTTMWGALKKR